MQNHLSLHLHINLICKNVVKLLTLLDINQYTQPKQTFRVWKQEALLVLTT